MIKRTTGLLALASLGLFLAAPVHATPHFVDGMVVAAKRDQGEDVRRDSRRDDYRSHRRDAERDTPPGYGYGYERRQQERSERHERYEEDSRPRGRR